MISGHVELMIDMLRLQGEQAMIHATYTQTFELYSQAMLHTHVLFYEERQSAALHEYCCEMTYAYYLLYLTRTC